MTSQQPRHWGLKWGLIGLGAIALAPIYIWPLLPLMLLAVPLMLILGPPLMAAIREESQEDDLPDDRPAYTWTPKPMILADQPRPRVDAGLAAHPPIPPQPEPTPPQPRI